MPYTFTFIASAFSFIPTAFIFLTTAKKKKKQHKIITTEIQPNEQKGDRLTAVCRNGGFSAFLETLVLVVSSGIFSNFVAESPPLLQAAERCR